MVEQRIDRSLMRLGMGATQPFGVRVDVRCQHGRGNPGGVARAVQVPNCCFQVRLHHQVGGHPPIRVLPTSSPLSELVQLGLCSARAVQLGHQLELAADHRPSVRVAAKGTQRLPILLAKLRGHLLMRSGDRVALDDIDRIVQRRLQGRLGRGSEGQQWVQQRQRRPEAVDRTEERVGRGAALNELRAVRQKTLCRLGGRLRETLFLPCFPELLRRMSRRSTRRVRIVIREPDLGASEHVLKRRARDHEVLLPQLLPPVRRHRHQLALVLRIEHRTQHPRSGRVHQLFVPEWVDRHGEPRKRDTETVVRVKHPVRSQ